MKKVLILILFLSAFQWGFSLSPADTLVVRGMRFGAPYHFINQKGIQDGYIPDVLSYICKDLGCEYKIIDNSIHLLDKKVEYSMFENCDLYMSGFSTEERVDSLFYSRPFVVEPQMVVYREELPYRTSVDFKGKKVVVVGYTSSMTRMNNFFNELYGMSYQNLIPVTMWGQGINLLLSKSVDFFVIDERQMTEIGPTIEYHNLGVTPAKISAMESSIVSKDSKLIEKIDKSLAKMTSDGTEKMLLEKWLIRNDTPTYVSNVQTFSLYTFFVLVLFILLALSFYLFKKKKNIAHNKDIRLRDEMINVTNLLLSEKDVDLYLYDRTTKETSTLVNGTFVPAAFVLSLNQEYIHPKDKESYKKIALKLTGDNKERFSFKLRVLKEKEKDEYIYWDCAAVPMMEEGKVSHYLISSKNITERENERLRAKKVQDYLKLGYFASDSACWAYNKKTKQLNPIHGNSVIPKVGMSMSSYFSMCHPDDVERIQNTFQEVLEGKVDKVQLIYRYKENGQYRIFNNYIISIKNEYGEVEEIAGARLDITKSTNNEIEIAKQNKELCELNNYLYLILEASKTSIWHLDIEQKLFKPLFGNKNVFDFKTTEEFLEKYIPQKQHEQYYNMLSDLLEGGKEVVSTTFRLLLDGQKGEHYRLCTMKKAEDNSHKIICAIRDVTEEFINERSLKEALVRAENSDKSKLAFLANMSHEIRTPLNAIVGFSELLIDTEVSDEEKEEFVRIIKSTNIQLITLVNDILDISKIENGIELVHTDVNVSELFNELTSALKVRCNNSEVEYIVENPYENLYAKIDFPRIAQIVTNLTTNAIKHTKKGSIRVGYSYDKEQELFELYVKDTGGGIPEEKKSLIFGRFQKLDTHTQGTGLGLSIVKALSKCFGFECGFDSVEGKGSYFWVRGHHKMMFNDNMENEEFTSDFPQVFPRSEEDALTKKNLNILIAEDNDSNYILLAKLLKGYRVTRASNGEEAVTFASLNKYDIIFMDIRMPILNGLDATQRIRKHNLVTPIIAVTANAFNKDRIEAMNAGCNDFITKPVNKKELNKKLLEYT